METASGAGSKGQLEDNVVIDSETVRVKIPPVRAGAWSWEVQP